MKHTLAKLSVVGFIASAAVVGTLPSPSFAASNRTASWKKPIEVLCVGDSITFGYGAVESYPDQLGNLLGHNYMVLNEGVSGTTMLKKGDLSYWYQPNFMFASWKPKIVILMLGTNDSKPQNWKYKAQFVKDYEAMVKHFQNLPTHPVVFLNTPPKVYGNGLTGINDQTVGKQIAPIVKQIAHDMHLTVVDIYSATSGMPQNFPDHVHPNDTGAHTIAVAVYRALKRAGYAG